MAKHIQAIAAYRPRIIRGKTVSEERYIELMTQRSILSAGIIKNVHENEIENVISLLQDSYVVHTGNVIYTLSITLDGKYEVNVKPHRRIVEALNTSGAFRGEIANAENIGKSSDELVEMWNEKHPDNLIGG